MRDFFIALYGDTEGFIPAVTYPKAERTSEKPWKDWRLTDNRWFKWPQQVDELVAYCEEKRKEDVYVTVGVCKTKNRSAESVKALKVAHCDADRAKPGLFALPPSIVVESSPGNYQLYWVLDKPYKTSKVEPLSKAATYSQLDAGADKNGWWMGKLLRVPGTRNTKPAYDNPKVKCKITDRVYTPEDLRKAFPPAPVSIAPEFRPIPLQLPTFSEVLSKIPASDMEFAELMEKSADEMVWNTKGSRYRVIWALSNKAYEYGLGEAAAYVLVKHSRSDKYAQDGRSDMELWRDVCKAKDAYVDDSANWVFVDENEAGEPQKVKVQHADRVEFLTPQEREQILPTFVERYAEWAKGKTQADPKYHATNALTLLATVLADFGYVFPKWGTENLHLWFMVLGVTTASHKTTAWRLVKEQFLDILAMDREHKYTLASDTTPESMKVDLAERGETSNLFHKDEAHGMVAASKGEKSYMAGFTVMLTELFDGNVPATSRIARGHTEESKTFLSLNLMGVPGKMTEMLTRDDFRSGFLARFVFVLGTPAEITPENMWVDKGRINKSGDRAKDKAYEDLLWEVQKCLIFWRDKTEGKGRLLIDVEDDAWRRWNEFSYEIVKMTAVTDDPEMIMPTAKRSSLLVLRVAALLAMAELKTVVEMRHMLTAISYCEEWYRALLMLASLVHQNEWARKVQELVDWLTNSPGQSRTQAQAQARFSGYKLREFLEILESAIATGRVNRRTNESANGRAVPILEIK